jgi:hypothetical protein
MSDVNDLPGLPTRLFVQARAGEAGTVGQLAAEETVGAVFTGSNRAAARAAVTAFRMKCESAPVMLDASRYSGRNRTFAGQGVSGDWIKFQRQLGLPWQLTDSGYIGDGDVNGLTGLLDDTRRAGDGVFAVLPLASTWWTIGRNEQLIEEVSRRGVPVALVLEHPDDPFSAFRTVQGVLNLVRAVPAPVLLLRSDTSGLGILANGGAAAAVGTASALRHLYPMPKKPGGGGGRGASISMLWTEGMSYRSVEKLTDAIAADPDDPHWNCMCYVCFGRSIEWILNSHSVHTDAYRHSVAALRTLVTDIESGQASWHSLCLNAQWKAYEVAEMSGKSWEPPKFLGAWNRALATPVS